MFKRSICFAGLLAAMAGGSPAFAGAKFATDPAYYELSSEQPQWEVTYKGVQHSSQLNFFNLKGYWPAQPNHQLYKGVKTATGGWVIGSAYLSIAPIAPPTKNHYVFCKVVNTSSVRFTITNHVGTVSKTVPVQNGLAISPPFLVDTSKKVPLVGVESADVNYSAAPTAASQSADWGLSSCIVNTGL